MHGQCLATLHLGISSPAYKFRIKVDSLYKFPHEIDATFNIHHHLLFLLPLMHNMHDFPKNSQTWIVNNVSVTQGGSRR